MSKHYEELSGAAGRELFYRPLRHQAEAVFAAAPPRLFFDDLEFALANISAVGVGGVSTDPAASAAIHSVNRRGVLRLVQRGRELYRGQARQARADLVRGRAEVGFALEEASFDFDLLRRRNACALAASPSREAVGAVPGAYKSFCAEIIDFIGGRFDLIERHIAPIEKDIAPADRAAIALDLQTAASAEWMALIERGNELVAPLWDDKKLRDQMKAFTERTVTRALMDGASWSRSYLKPQGYPGDYQIMNYMYDGTPHGTSVRDMFSHLLGVSAGQPIVSRMRRLADIIVAHGAARLGEGRRIDIMSVGAGPARELERIVATAPSQARWRATLVDQEPEAIEYALANVRRRGLGKAVEIAPLNVSFKEMLAPSGLTRQFADKDVIYSSGLVDYLSPLSAARFVKRMYDFLRPGGMLVIGNVNNLTTGTLWPMEYVLDWTLYFRSRADMLAMAREIDGARVSIVADEMNAIYFLVAEKPD